MNPVLERCLEDLESRIDEDQERSNEAAWKDFLDDGVKEGFFVPPRRRPSPPGVEWPEIHINDAQDDRDLMILSQFRAVSEVLARGLYCPLAVRSNYGVGILASQFGCRIIMMPREQNNLPTSFPLNSRDTVRELLDAGNPPTDAGLGDKVFDTAEALMEVFRIYPGIGRWVHLYHPDLQGPIDNVELVWGSDMFLAMYEEPETVKACLRLITDQYIRFMKRWYELVRQEDRAYSVHWTLWHKGSLMIRNDSLMNLSPDMYVEFVRPFDQELLDTFGGGAIHFCGRGDHFIEEMSRMSNMSAIALSQPHLNEMEKVFRNTVDKGIKLLNLSRAAVDAAHRPLKGQVQTTG